MKKVLFYVIFCTAVVIAYMMGSLNASVEVAAPLLTPQQQAFEQRVEHYQPSCQQLTSLGRSVAQISVNDTLTVYTTVDRFYVFGVNLSEQHPPTSHWWAGDRQAALAECLSRQVAND